MKNVEGVRLHFVGQYKIAVLDGLFSWAEIEGIYVNICNLQYRISNSNQLDIQNIQDKKLKADIDIGFLKSVRFFDEGRESLIESYFKDGDYDIHKAYINCGLKGDSHNVHVDNYFKSSGKTLLYYANRDWNPNHGGETIFYCPDTKDIVFISTYKPGRIIIFDSEVPHSARPQALDGPNYRFTMALKYIKV